MAVTSNPADIGVVTGAPPHTEAEHSRRQTQGIGVEIGAGPLEGHGGSADTRFGGDSGMLSFMGRDSSGATEVGRQLRRSASIHAFAGRLEGENGGRVSLLPRP